jgi:hypothetical protein
VSEVVVIDESGNVASGDLPTVGNGNATDTDDDTTDTAVSFQSSSNTNSSEGCTDVALLARRAFRHISLACHPDKTRDATLNAIFARALENERSLNVSECEKLVEALSLCVRLKLRSNGRGALFDLSECEHETAQRAIFEGQTSIQKLRSSPLWGWNSLPDATRERILGGMKIIHGNNVY